MPLATSHLSPPNRPARAALRSRDPRSTVQPEAHRTGLIRLDAVSLGCGRQSQSTFDARSRRYACLSGGYCIFGWDGHEGDLPAPDSRREAVESELFVGCCWVTAASPLLWAPLLRGITETDSVHGVAAFLGLDGGGRREPERLVE